jgi:hypothetical protein
MSTINYTYNVIVDRFRQFAAGHFQLRRFTHGEISQADLEKEAEWPWLHVKPRAINYSPGTRSFQFEIFISDLPRDKEDKTGYQAESITDCSLIFQDLINEIYLGNMFGTDAVLTRPVNSEPFVEQYTHTLTGVTGTIELNLDYDWSACSIPASWNYNTPTDSGSDGWGALQFIESLDQNGVFVSLDGDVEAPGNSYYYGTNASGVKGWYAIVDNVGLTCETLPECATIISIVDDIAALQTDVALKANTADLGATAFSNDYNDLDNLPTIPAAQVNSDWNATSGVAEILNKPTIPSISGLVPETRTLTINGTTQDLSANRTFTIATGLTVGTTPITSGTVGRVLFEGTGNVLQESANITWNNTTGAFNVIGLVNAKSTATQTSSLIVEGTTGVNSGNAGFALKTGTGYQPIFFAADSLAGQGVAGLGIYSGNTTPFGIQTGAPNSAFFIHSNGNIGIGTNYINAGYKLDVNGTARVSGNLTAGLTTGDNLFSFLGASNGFFRVRTLSGAVFLGLGNTTNATSGSFFGITRSYLNEYGNNVNGFMSTDNVDFTFRFGAFGSSVEGLRITTTQVLSAQRFVLSASTTTRSSMNIPSGTAPTSPVNGDIWFDGTDIKMRIGGVTKTFTLT